MAIFVPAKGWPSDGYFEKAADLGFVVGKAVPAKMNFWIDQYEKAQATCRKILVEPERPAGNPV